MNNICRCPFPYCGDISLIKFINPCKISFNCLRRHNLSENISKILKSDTNNKFDKENILYDSCKEHKSKFIFFCKSCQINFCYFCKQNHDIHKYLSIKEKIPPNHIYNNLNKYIKQQKNILEKINLLFDELIQKVKDDFNKIYKSLYDYLLCEESILEFSINNINHLNSIENIKYILDLNFNPNKLNTQSEYDLSNIKFNIEELKLTLDQKPLFEQIEQVYKYLNNIFILSNEKIDKQKIIKKSFTTLYKKPFLNNKKNLEKVNKSQYDKIQKHIEKIKLELKQYKILNEHENEIRNIVSLNNGFFITSSLDGTFKIFNSLTGEKILSMKEPYEDQICHILQIKPNNEMNILDKTNILVLSKHLIFIRLNNSCLYSYKNKIIENLDTDLDDNNDIEILQSIDNHGLYISQGIQLSNSDIVVYTDNNEIKIYKINPQTKTYLLHNYNINPNLIEFCSLLEIKPNIFAASSNKHLENGDNIIKVFDLNTKEEKIIKNLNCSTGRDSLCMIQKNKKLAVGLQYFHDNNDENNKHSINGIGIIDVEFCQVIQIIEDIRVHSLCSINLYINYYLMNKNNIFQKERFYKKKKILVAAGYDKENERRLIKFFEIIIDNDDDKNKYVDIVKRNEIISEHEGFINSIKWLKNGLLVTGSSDKMIFIFNDVNLDIQFC